MCILLVFYKNVNLFFLDKKSLNESESEESPEPSDNDSFIDDESGEESPVKVYYIILNYNHHLTLIHS